MKPKLEEQGGRQGKETNKCAFERRRKLDMLKPKNQRTPRLSSHGWSWNSSLNKN